MISPTHLKRKGPAWFSKCKTRKMFKHLIPLVKLQFVGFSCSTIACHDTVMQPKKVWRFLREYSCIISISPCASWKSSKNDKENEKQNAYPIFGEIRRQVYSPDSKVCKRPPNATELVGERGKCRERPYGVGEPKVEDLGGNQQKYTMKAERLVLRGEVFPLCDRLC